MLRFRVYREGRPAQSVDLNGSYLVGTDGVPLRAEIEFRNGEILCRKRAHGPAGLALLWPIKGMGRVLLETSRLQERHEPYNLSVELARGRLMRISQKREDWGLFDYEDMGQLGAELDRARDLFIESLKADEPARAACLADEALEIATIAGEKLSLFHADVFLDRRSQGGTLPRHLFGCGIDPACTDEAYRRRILEAFDFVCLPILWRNLEPKEQEYHWATLDAWVEWLTRHRMPIKACPLVAFNERNIPDWLYIWEHDFDTVRDLVYEHIRRIVERYGGHVQAWGVISGIHADNTFGFTFEQLMELTRMAAVLTKQLVPRATTIVELVAPWGEYYARNQRTIPPLLYADMAVQSGINFDAFGLQLYFGVGIDGMYVRDMFQISSLIDRIGSLGKPVHITAVQVPSASTPDRWDAWGGALSPAEGGIWHEAWNEQVQARWLRDFYTVALSKPFVETVAWRDLTDQRGHYLPHGGLLRADMSPKPAFQALRQLRSEMHNLGRS